MAQSSDLGAIANVAGAVFRASNNAGVQALASMNAGASAPSPTYQGMTWWDTTNSLIKRRNTSNTAWVTTASYNGTTWIPYRAGVAIDALATVKHNLTSTVDPGAGDDSADGYSVGSLWLNTVDDDAFICLDATANAAVWRQINNPTSTGVTKYSSGYQAIQANTEYPFTHGLGGIPDGVTFYLQCTQADGPYTTNDVAIIHPGVPDVMWVTQTPLVRRRHSPALWVPSGSTSQIRIRTPSFWFIPEKSNGTGYMVNGINYARWRLNVVAVRFS